MSRPLCVWPPCASLLHVSRHAWRPQALQDGLLDSLLPLLRPGQAWVIQGRCCGVLANLLRLQQRTEVTTSPLPAAAQCLYDVPR